MYDKTIAITDFEVQTDFHKMSDMIDWVNRSTDVPEKVGNVLNQPMMLHVRSPLIK